MNAFDALASTINRLLRPVNKLGSWARSRGTFENFGEGFTKRMAKADIDIARTLEDASRCRKTTTDMITGGVGDEAIRESLHSPVRAVSEKIESINVQSFFSGSKNDSDRLDVGAAVIKDRLLLGEKPNRSDVLKMLRERRKQPPTERVIVIMDPEGGPHR